eukprot:TRINITY_DN5388_c0_g1_i9.p1 TRINITY_DN5388_c0_g1~~TRINITY_DN5388_c0_g1_i9.p1  ORF type:complete len:561 (-),score=171.26 TRINITY_DN5388_c0_g1_i9:50-1732(-)
MHSIEELPEAKGSVMKLLVALLNNWRNFLELTQRKIKDLKEDICKSKEELKGVRNMHKAEIEEWEKKIEKQKAKFETKSIVKELNAFKKKHQQMKTNIGNERKEMTSNLSILKAENQRLQASFDKLKEQADVVKNAITIDNLTTELSHAKEQNKKLSEEKADVAFKLGTLVSSAKSELMEKASILSAKLEENEGLVQKCRNKEKELAAIKKQLKETQEKMSMTSEDIFLSQIKLSKMETLLRENHKITEDQEKTIKELEIQIQLQQEGLVQRKTVSVEGTLFHFVWDDQILRSNNKNANTAKHELDNKPAEENKEPTIAQRIEGTGEVKLDSISLKRFSYLRPAYRALVDALLPQGEKVNYLPPFPIWLHTTVRAIFDSLLHELLLCTSRGKPLSKFPEFVYAWLGVFTVDDTGGIRRLEYIEHETVARKSRSDILLGLEAGSAGKHWELVIFREFLEEQLGLDELVYYLHCRFVLFRGTQLAIPGAKSCVVSYVTKERVFETVDKVMNGFSVDEKEQIKKNLEEFSKETYKNPNAFDSGMVYFRSLLSLIHISEPTRPY